MSAQQIKQEAKYYTRTPNILFESYEHLHPQEKWLYINLVYLCGKEGTRHLSLRYISDRTGISIGALSGSKNPLKNNPGMIRNLHNAGLIHAEIKRRVGRNGKESEQAQYHISIVDIWQLNLDYFIVIPKCSDNEQSNDTGVQNMNKSVQNMNSSSPERSEYEQERSDFDTNIRIQDKTTDTNKTTKQEDIVVSAIAENDAPANVYHFEAEKKKRTDPRIPIVASHSQVDIGNFEGVDEEDFEGETVPRIEAMPKQQTPGAGSPPAATPPGGSTAASVQASRPGPPVDAAQRTASSPGTPSGAVQASVRDEKPPMALTAKQIKAQYEKRAKEIWAIIEDERKTKYTTRQRALFENDEGIKGLIEDDVSDEHIRAGLQALDAFQSKSFTVLKFYGWLPNLQAKKPIPIQNGKAPAKDQNIGVSGLPRLQVRKVNYSA